MAIIVSCVDGRFKPALLIDAHEPPPLILLHVLSSSFCTLNTGTILIVIVDKPCRAK